MEPIQLLATAPIRPITSLTPDVVPRAPIPHEGSMYWGDMTREGRAFNPGWLTHVDEKAV